MIASCSCSRSCLSGVEPTIVLCACLAAELACREPEHATTLSARARIQRRVHNLEHLRHGWNGFKLRRHRIEQVEHPCLYHSNTQITHALHTVLYPARRVRRLILLVPGMAIPAHEVPAQRPCPACAKPACRVPLAHGTYAQTACAQLKTTSCMRRYSVLCIQHLSMHGEEGVLCCSDDMTGSILSPNIEVFDLAVTVLQQAQPSAYDRSI